MPRKLKVGDIITSSTWGAKYEVLAVKGRGYYDLRNIKCGDTVIDWYYRGTYGLIFTTDNIYESGKSAVENKIAVMYKRFENRKNHV